MSTEKENTNIELVKVQIYADSCHNVYTSSLAVPYAIFITFTAVLYTLLLQNIISWMIYYPVEAIIVMYVWYSTDRIRKRYKRKLEKISDMIENVKDRKELPKLDELLKKSKD